MGGRCRNNYYCKEQVKIGNMTQQEADEIIERYE